MGGYNTKSGPIVLSDLMPECLCVQKVLSDWIWRYLIVLFVKDGRDIQKTVGANALHFDWLALAIEDTLVLRC